MTRISSAIRAIELCDAHLIKERIEILRIPNMIKSGKAKINLSKIPKQFTLGKGHVIFFYDKISYLNKRYLELTNECISRGFEVTDFSDSFNGINSSLWNDYIESDTDRLIVKERIVERLKGMKNLKYYRKPITLDDLINKMNNE